MQHYEELIHPRVNQNSVSNKKDIRRLIVSIEQTLG